MQLNNNNVYLNLTKTQICISSSHSSSGSSNCSRLVVAVAVITNNYYNIIF